MPLCRFLPQYAIPSRKPCSISEKRRLLPRIARQTRFVDEGFVCLPAKVFRVTTSKRSLGQDCCTDTGKGSSSWVSAARAGVQREDSFITIAFFLLSATFSLHPMLFVAVRHVRVTRRAGSGGRFTGIGTKIRCISSLVVRVAPAGRWCARLEGLTSGHTSREDRLPASSCPLSSWCPFIPSSSSSK